MTATGDQERAAAPSPTPPARFEAQAIETQRVSDPLGALPVGEVPAPAFSGQAAPSVVHAQSYPNAYVQQQPFIIEAPPGGALGGRVMLSVEWAGAIKEYSHSLISPLVDLLREKDARIEEKERVIHSQAEALARAHLELELRRAEVSGMQAELAKLRDEGDSRVAETQKEMRVLRTQLKQAEATLRMLQTHGSPAADEHEHGRRWWWPFGE